MRKWGPPCQPLGSTAWAFRAAPITLMALHGQREEGQLSTKYCLWKKLFHHTSLDFSSLSSASSGLSPGSCAGGPAGGSWLGCNPSPARRGGPSWSSTGTGFMWHVVFTRNKGKVFPLRIKKKDLLHKAVSKRHNIKEKREQWVAWLSRRKSEGTKKNS